MNPIELISVNLSTAKGTPKQPVAAASCALDGFAGDAHAGPGHRQVSLLDAESIERFSTVLGRTIAPGEFAENLTVRGLCHGSVRPLDRLRFDAVELEVTQIGKACHGDGCAIFQQVGRCVMPKEGVFARVIQGGELRAGMKGEFQPRTLQILVLTLSDRAAAGVYEDLSGPRLERHVHDWLAAIARPGTVRREVLPDDAPRLAARLAQARAEQVDVVFTTGGTGIGPRDITPEVVARFCDKLLPGVMDHIRLKYGAANARALLSCSVAGVAGSLQIYALPGSVRAVDEYMAEIAPLLQHVLYMLNELPH